MQQINHHIKRLLSTKAAAFLKKSFLFSILYASMLYIVVRVFFYEFPITVAEGFELHSKMLLVIWMFIVACKLAFSGIVLLENNIDKVKVYHRFYAITIKRSIVIILTAILSYTGKTGNHNITGSRNNSTDEPVVEADMAL